MPVDKQLMALHFSRHAADYDSVTRVQQAMGERLWAMADVQRAEDVLELGCGTGNLTARICRAQPNVQITAVDIAAGMLDQARAKLVGEAAVDFVYADAEAFAGDNADGRWDLIISNAAAQWFAHLAGTIHTLGGALTADGMLAISVLGDGTFCELRKSFELAGGAPDRRVQALPSAAELKAAVAAAGLDVSLEERRTVEYYADVRSFLRTVQLTGAASAMAERVPLRRDVLRRMMEAYTVNFATQKGIPATYHELYVVGRRG
jgi:malonyl-CoA O-methyltransferase